MFISRVLANGHIRIYGWLVSHIILYRFVCVPISVTMIEGSLFVIISEGERMFGGGGMIRVVVTQGLEGSCALQLVR